MAFAFTSPIALPKLCTTGVSYLMYQTPAVHFRPPHIGKHNHDYNLSGSAPGRHRRGAVVVFILLF